MLKKWEKGVVDVCPLCGSKLDKGYMASRMIAWSDKKISDESFSGVIMGGGFLALGAETIISKGWHHSM